VSPSALLRSSSSIALMLIPLPPSGMDASSIGQETTYGALEGLHTNPQPTTIWNKHDKDDRAGQGDRAELTTRFCAQVVSQSQQSVRFVSSKHF